MDRFRSRPARRLAAVLACCAPAGCPRTAPHGAPARAVSGDADLAADATVAAGAPERVAFHTDDGWLIAGDYAPGDGGVAIVLVHQLGSDRREWEPLVARLHREMPEASTLAIDLRGHGESTQGPTGPTRWVGFGNDAARWAGARRDVAAALQYLRARGRPPVVLAAIGAALGANAALLAAQDEPEVRSLVLLSPGANYRGLATLEAMTRYAGGGRAALLLATRGDAPAASSTELLVERAGDGGRVVARVFPGTAAHGVTLAAVRTEVWGQVMDWLRAQVHEPRPGSQNARDGADCASAVVDGGGSEVSVPIDAASERQDRTDALDSARSRR